MSGDDNYPFWNLILTSEFVKKVNDFEFVGICEKPEISAAGFACKTAGVIKIVPPNNAEIAALLRIIRVKNYFRV